MDGVGTEGEPGGIEAPCPLCGTVFHDDAAYGAHLAAAHDLVDDDGVATTLEQALVVSGIAGDRAIAEAAAAAQAPVVSSGPGANDLGAVPSNRVYDPGLDDLRLKPIVLGLTGILLLIGVAVGLALTVD